MIKKREKTKKASNSFLKMFKYLKYSKIATPLLIASVVFSTFLAWGQILISAQILDSFANFVASHTLTLVLYLAGLKILFNICWAGWDNTTTFIVEKILTHLRHDIFAKIVNTKTYVFDKLQTGFIAEKSSIDADRLSWTVAEFLRDMSSFVMNIIVATYIFSLNLYISITIATFVLAYILITKKRNAIFMLNHEKFRSEADSVTSYFGESMKGIHDIKILNAKAHHVKSFDDKVTKFMDSFYIRQNKDNLFSLGLALLNLVFYCFLILAGIFLVKNNQLTLGQLFIVYAAYARIISIGGLYSALNKYVAEGTVNATRINEVLNTDSFPVEHFGKINLDNAIGNIEFRDVTFGYNKNQKVLNNLNVSFKNGEMVGIIGESGCGKTTILSVLSKLYTVDSGQILIDGVDINCLSENAIRKNITLVTQDPYIFYDTIFNNLKLAKQTLTLEEAIDACKKTYIHDYIINLPQGYDTLIGENGINLSGGQKQRLALARALVNVHKIILLDEATSSLDNENQAKIQATLEKISKSHTLIVVAHRLSTIINAKKLIIIKEGKVFAEGTHSELIENNAYYNQLYNKK